MPIDPSDIPPCRDRTFRPEGTDPFSAGDRGSCVIQHGAERGQEVRDGVLQTGPQTGQRVGSGGWNNIVRYQCLPSRIGLPNADLVRIEEQLLNVSPGSSRVLVNGDVETPGNACFDMSDPRQALDVIRQCTGDFWGVSDSCLSLFSGVNARENAEAFVATYRAGYARNPQPAGEGEGTVAMPEPLLEPLRPFIERPLELLPQVIGAFMVAGISAWAGLEAVGFIFGVRVPQWQNWHAARAAAQAARQIPRTASAGEWVTSSTATRTTSQTAAQAARTGAASGGRSLVGRILTGLGNAVLTLGGFFITPVIAIRRECGPDDAPQNWGITCSGGGA